MKTADLHIHTLASDGALSVDQVLRHAVRTGLSAIAITDHDTVGALPEAMALAPEYGIEVVPGIELSVDFHESEVHLLGYYIDYRDQKFLDRLSEFQKDRKERARKMVEKLEELGLPLNMEKLLPGQMTGVIGRLHIAQALLKAGYIKNIQEAFAKYIGRHGPAYVSRIKLSKEEALKMIRERGGVPILAHPGQLNKDDVIPELIKLGLAGLEVYYPSHSKFESNHYLELARYYGLLITGGSDCHGPNKGEVRIGSIRLPYKYVELLKKEASKN